VKFVKTNWRIILAYAALFASLIGPFLLANASTVDVYGDSEEAVKNVVDLNFTPKYNGKQYICHYYAHLKTVKNAANNGLFIGVCDGGYFITTYDRKFSYWIDAKSGEALEVSKLIGKGQLLK
jgi:hypothetical protein